MKSRGTLRSGARLAALCLNLTFLVCPGVVRGEIKLASLFSDHAVLQRDVQVPVWGWASPGDRVTVALCGQTQSTVADENGKWKVVLQPLRAGGPYDMTVTGKDTIIVSDLLVGEVWLCSGQSNMGWPVSEATNAQAEIAAAGHPKIRVFRIYSNAADAPQQWCGGDWLICNPTTVGGFSAVAYFFARDLHEHLHVPVGLLPVSVGSSFAENWTNRTAMLDDPDLKPIVERSDAVLLDWAKDVQRIGTLAATWRQEAIVARANDKRLPPLPKMDFFLNPMWLNTIASGMYNGMIAPLAPYTIRGAIWYQGEANTTRAYQYRKLLPALIKNWREIWGQGDFPFLFVQLPNNFPAKNLPAESEWAELRESQLKVAQSVHNVGMAVAIDIGEANSIHPRNKQELARRLLLLARALAYGEKVVRSGPISDSVTVEGGRIVVRFKNAAGGLMAKGGPLRHFAIAGDDRKFVWADARIVGDSVVVSSRKVRGPVAVRYAWTDNPEGCNLYNAEGLPVSPFRTDDWPGLTRDRR